MLLALSVFFIGPTKYSHPQMQDMAKFHATVSRAIVADVVCTLGASHWPLGTSEPKHHVAERCFLCNGEDPLVFVSTSSDAAAGVLSCALLLLAGRLCLKLMLSLFHGAEFPNALVSASSDAPAGAFLSSGFLNSSGSEGESVSIALHGKDPAAGTCVSFAFSASASGLSGTC